MFKLGIITNSISQDIVHALDVAKQLGIRHVEIHSLWGKSIENLSDQEIRQVKEFITDRELEVSCVSSTVFLRCRLGPGGKIVWETSFISSEGNYAAHIKMLKRAIEMADILETPVVRCFGFWKEDEMTASFWQEMVQRFQEPVRMVEEAGMTLALENCPHSNIPTAGTARKFLEEIASPHLKLLWDPVNAYASGEVDYLAGYQQVKSEVAHVHIKDVILGPNGEREYVAIDDGEMDIPRLLQALAREYYNGVLSLENTYVPEGGTLEQGARESIARLKAVLERFKLTV
ncbi:MAG: sugar phosphate isomerase/epimerase family protein [Anaerolineae bacterium]